jgi:hypothetical protein
MELLDMIKKWERVGLAADDAIGIRGCSIEQFLEHLEAGGIEGSVGGLSGTGGEMAKGIYFCPYFEHLEGYIDPEMLNEFASETIRRQIASNKKNYAKPGAFEFNCCQKELVLQEADFERIYSLLKKKYSPKELAQMPEFDETRKFANMDNKQIAAILSQAYQRQGMQFTLKKSALKYRFVVDEPSEAMIASVEPAFCLDQGVKVFKPGYGQLLGLEHISGIKVYRKKEMDELIAGIQSLQKMAG